MLFPSGSLTGLKTLEGIGGTLGFGDDTVDAFLAVGSRRDADAVPTRAVLLGVLGVFAAAAPVFTAESADGLILG